MKKNYENQVNEKDKYRILCVDDEPLVLKAIKRILRSDVYEIITVTDAHEGLLLLNKIKVHLVLSDLMMPS